MASETSPIDQYELTRISIRLGQLLMQHGAESMLIADLSRRMGRALGLQEVHVTLTANAINVTSVQNQHCVTTVRYCRDHGIHMGVVTELQHLVVMAEHKVLDAYSIRERLNKINPERYNRWLVLFMVGLSCAAFSMLAGGDWTVFAMTFVATCCGMLVRQELGHRHFNPLLNFAATAFVTTAASAPALYFQLGNLPTVVMASSVLMLVPGVPLINAASDMVKGYINVGLSRWTMASLLTLATSIGIVMAINLFNLWPLIP
ncbi:threonine/serine exporter family protein [Ferrimonas senticii]|uniref:threonine/serine exporter family protein n=1 Tax=Ferrimonas senticii TaxID=394566 RepID=UPI0003F4AE0F|nr:threonine/serine exporter family protein [Ferrimonas senticii]